MAVGVSATLELLGQLVAAAAEARSMAADSVTDRIQAFDDVEAVVISRVLLWLALVETDDAAREAELNALAELAAYGLVTAEILNDIGQLSRAELRGSSIEHFDYLRSLPGKST